MLKSKWRLAVALAGSVLLVAGCNGPMDDDGEEGQDDQAAAEAQDSADAEQAPGDEDPMSDMPGMEEPDLDDIPDVVADVNGTEITRDDFVTVFEGQYQQMAMQSQMSGQEVDDDQLRTQTVESLVGTELLAQEAESRGLEASDDEVDEALAEFAETNQVSTEEFVSMMGEQGLDEDDVMDEIRTQLEIEALVTEEFGEFEVSDAELEEAYEQVVAQQEQMGGGEMGQEIPPLDEVRGELEEQMVAEEQGQAMQTLVDDLREDADVEIFL